MKTVNNKPYYTHKDFAESRFIEKKYISDTEYWRMVKFENQYFGGLPRGQHRGNESLHRSVLPIPKFKIKAYINEKTGDDILLFHLNGKPQFYWM